MAIRKLDSTQWNSYFRDFSKELIDEGRTDLARIRIYSRDVGAQTQADWMPLQGITYDPKDNLLEITVDGLDHLIFKPQEIFVDETNDGALTSMEIVHNGTKEVIELREQR